MRTLILTTMALLLCWAQAAAVDITGELKKWHTVTLTFDGPATSENATPNPFLDYRLNVTFSKGSTTYVVPGFYAADGNAANTGATSGDKWRVHFTPDQTGTWTYDVSFKQGNRVNVAIEGVDPDPTGTQPWTPLDGTSGNFSIAASDKTGVDFRARGRIEYVNDHHFAFAETGETFVKTGMDSAENFLGYVDFDQTFKDPNPFKGKTPKGIIHQFNAHAGDWQNGDPTWGQRNGNSGTYGKNIIGAINYLSGQQINSQYFLTYNIDGGDGMDTWIWRQVDERLRIDVSKMAQWEILFAHMDRKGVAQYVILQEQENQAKLGETEAPREGGGFGVKLNDGRRLYYRELVARFGHHLGLFWNYGEEDGTTVARRIENATYLRQQDPYDHPIGVHNPVDQVIDTANEIIGTSVFEFMAMQDNVEDYNAKAATIRANSAAAGRPLVVWADEQGPGVNDTDHYRIYGMWQAYMGGAGGVEWYAGGDDQSLDDYTPQGTNGRFQDFRALGYFFEEIVDPTTLSLNNSLVSGTDNTSLADPGTTYVVHLPSGGSTNVDLSAASASTTFDVRWYNPRAGDPGDGGGNLLTGSVSSVNGGSTRNLGNAPSATSSDWVVLVRVSGGSDNPPTADLSVSPTSVETGQTVTFDASGSSDDGSIVEYVFDFGDGNSTTTSNNSVSHSYATAGTYDATVSVEDDGGQTTQSTVQAVSVSNPVDNPPTADLSVSPTSVETGQTVTFDASGSSDDGNIVEYVFDFGDGNSTTTSNGSTTHSYATAGNYDATVSVEDDGGQTTQSSVQTVTVTDPPVGQSTFGNSGQPWLIADSYSVRIEAENYDQGGPGVAYQDGDTGNNGGAYRSEDVDVQTASDIGGGHNVGWINNGEWLEYTVDVYEAGSYQVDVRVARQPSGDSALHLEVGGNDVSGPVTIPSTGGWQTWTTVSTSIDLAAGEQVLRIAMDGSSFNLNWIEFVPAAIDLPPTADLMVSPINVGIGETVTFDASGSSDDGAIDEYHFDFGDGTTTTTNNSSATHSYAAAGTYQASVTVTDDASQQMTSSDVAINVLAGTAIDVMVTASSDDAEENGDQSIDLTSGDLDFGKRPYHGMRFTSIQIPQGATITSAYIQFTADDGGESNTSDLAIVGQDVDDAAGFTSTTGDISDRSRTTASVAWSVPAWNIAGERAAAQQTPDLSAVISEIVGRSGWTSGNDLVLFVENSSGDRSARSFDGNSADAPQLIVEYTSGGSEDVTDYLLRWNFENDLSEENGSGLDLSLTGNAAMVMDNALAGDYVLSLDGTDQADILNSDGSLLEDAFSERSMSVWFRTDTTSGLQILFEEGGSWNGIAMRLNGDQLEAAVQQAGVIHTAAVSGVTTGSWHHAVLVFAGSGGSGELSVYLDSGVPVSDATGFDTVNNHGSDPAIGGSSGGNAFDAGDDEFSGSIDDVRIWDRALTADEVEALFLSGLANPG